MKGYVRHRGGRWVYQVELGEQPAQVCPACGTPKRPARWFVDRRPLDACPRCGGPLEDVHARRRAFESFNLKREAEDALNKAITALGKNEYTAPAKLTVAQFARDQWLPAIAASVKPATLRSYTQHVDVYIVPRIGHLRLQKLSTEEISAMYAQLVKDGSARRLAKNKAAREAGSTAVLPSTGLSHNTVIRIAATTHRMLRDAKRWHRIARNPADDAERPKISDQPRHEMQVWTREQLGAFLDATKDDREYALWHVLAMTGLRRGEALGLRWSDVDFEGSRLTVRQAITVVGYEVQVTTPKSGKSRPVPIDPDTVQVLKDEAAWQLDQQTEWGAAWSDTGLVFVREDGQGLHPDRASKLFDKAVAKAKLPRIRLYDLRHTHASHLLQAGVHPKVVQERLGHAKIGITMDTYSHLMPDMQEDAAAANAALILATRRT
jgi:integrase